MHRTELCMLFNAFNPKCFVKACGAWLGQLRLVVWSWYAMNNVSQYEYTALYIVLTMENAIHTRTSLVRFALCALDFDLDSNFSADDYDLPACDGDSCRVQYVFSWNAVVR